MRAALALLLLPLTSCTQRTDLLATNAATVCAASGVAPALAPELACPSLLATGLFTRAICSCADLSLPGALATHLPPMSMPPSGPPMPSPPSGVATNGALAVAGTAQLFGGAEVAGAGGARFDSYAVVVGELASGGPVAATQLLSVAGDLFAAGDLAGRIDVSGELHLAPGADVGPGVSARGLVREPISVPPPCRCAPRDVDAAAVAHAHAAHNDDAAIALADDALAHTVDGATLDLPCGAYYVRAVAGAALGLRVHGKAALFVDGDVALAGALQIALDPGAELDLVVAGNLDVAALTGATPTAMRVWIGGAEVRVATGALSGLVYAPAATLVSGGALNATGALYVGGLAVGGDVEVRFDRPTSAGSACR